MPRRPPPSSPDLPPERQHEADHGQRTDRPTSVESEELRRLRKENTDPKRTNEILKLASAYFAQELDPTRRRS